MKKCILTFGVVSSLLFMNSCSNTTNRPSRGIASDGLTPAQESVCDELQGMTPGLYGLCVAYCEAQDGPELVQEDVPLEDQPELSVPNRKILSNYDKKRQDGDPRMPCVQYVSSCPVWTPEELQSIGSYGAPNLRDYVSISSNRERLFDQEYGYYDNQGGFVSTHALLDKTYRRGLFYYTGRFYRYVRSPYEYIRRQMPLTEQEFNSCKQQLLDHVTNPNN